MGYFIYQSIQLFSIFTIFCELLFSLMARRRTNCPKCLKNFYFYPMIGSIMGLMFLLKEMNFLPSNFCLIVNKISLFFHFIFLGYFFYRITEKNIIIKTLVLFVPIILIVLVAIDVINGTNSSFALANGCLFIFSIFYFSQIFLNSKAFSLFKNPISITCCGIFIGSGITIPFALMHKYLMFLDIPKDTMLLYGSLFASGYLIMNLFFLRAMVIVSKYE